MPRLERSALGFWSCDRAWATSLMQSRRKAGPATRRHHDSVIGILRDGGFTIDMAAHAFSVMDLILNGLEGLRGAA